ncbi:MAG: hypothetical protein V1912_08900 [bacterium]
MSRRRKTLLVILPVALLIIALLLPGVGLASSGKGSGKGVVHQLYTAADGTVYNSIYHVNNGKETVTGAIYPKSGPLKFYPKSGPLKVK